MLEIAFALAILLLAVAVALLFAMMGELASRIPEFSRPLNQQQMRPVEGAKLGHMPASWPSALRPMAADENALLLVLSSACASCEEIGRQLRKQEPARNLALVVSCSSRETGEAFMSRHELRSHSHFVDVGGDWIRGEFGVQVSPSGLLLRRGQLESALIIHDVKSVFQMVTQASPIPERIGRVIA